MDKKSLVRILTFAGAELACVDCNTLSSPEELHLEVICVTTERSDLFLNKDDVNRFSEFGLTVYVGQQSETRVAAMIDYLRCMKQKYPRCVVVTNFNCDYSDYHMKGWQDILRFRNRTDGVIFAIDEIHSEYSSVSWKDVPHDLISLILQQRLLRFKIIGSTQSFFRIPKFLRELIHTVVICKSTFGSRLIFCNFCYVYDYVLSLDLCLKRVKSKPIQKSFFINRG